MAGPCTACNGGQITEPYQYRAADGSTQQGMRTVTCTACHGTGTGQF